VRAVQKGGITDSTFHDLRHTFALRLVMGGVDLPTVKDLMGHKRINMLLRYTHVPSDHLQHAVDILEQFAYQVPSMFTIGQINKLTKARKSLIFPLCRGSSVGRAED